MPDHPPNIPAANQPDAPKQNRSLKGPRRWPWVVIVLVLLLGAGIVYLRQRSPKSPPAARGRPAGGGQPPLMVSTATAQKGDIGVYVNALGVVTPVNTVSVKSRVDGQLVKVHYVEGQIIHQGDPLLEIDPAPFQAAL